MANYNKPTVGFHTNPERRNNGRTPREWTWKGLLEQASEEMIDLKNEDGEVVSKGKLKDIVAKRVWKMAANGDIQAIKEIFNRMDGMPVQDITSGGEKIELPMVYIPEEKK